MNKRDLETDKNNEEYVSYFEENRSIANRYDKQLGLLLVRAKSIFEHIDTTDTDDVEFANVIVNKINALIDTICETQKIEIPRLKAVNYTDIDGNPLINFFTYVVGSILVDKGETNYVNRRLVKARDYKEAVLKYKKVVDDGSTTVSCFGIFDENELYSKSIENMEIIE